LVASIVRGRRWLDELTNDAKATAEISKVSSHTAALVIPTDEEQVIADEALSVLKQEGVSHGSEH
jgi:acetate kinase